MFMKFVARLCKHERSRWLNNPKFKYLFQGLLPAVALVAEGAGELLGVSSVALTTLTPVQVLDAHLLLEVLLEAGLVGELPEAVGALQGPVLAVMRRLSVVIQEPLLGEVLSAVEADERALPSVDSVVDVQVGLPRVGLGADGADERLFSRVHPDVLLKRVVVVASLVAKRAHEIRRTRVRRHVRS